MGQPLLPAAPSPPLAPRRGAAPLPAPSQQYLSSSRASRGPVAAARQVSGSGGRKALRSAAVAAQQEEQPLEQGEQPGELQLEGGWSEELQREFEAYKARIPVGERQPRERTSAGLATERAYGCTSTVCMQPCPYASRSHPGSPLAVSACNAGCCTFSETCTGCGLHVAPPYRAAAPLRSAAALLCICGLPVPFFA